MRSRERKEPIDVLVEEIENDDRIRIARPVYYREDLAHPNGFTFDDQIIVKLDVETKVEMLQPQFRELGIEKVTGPKGELGVGLVLLQLNERKKHNVYEIAHQLAQTKFIKEARVNMIQLHSGYETIPNDIYFPNQWNLRNTGQSMPDGKFGTPGCDINIEPAWNISKGSPLVVIAIVDSGCDLGHPDLLRHLVQPDRWYNAETGDHNAEDYYKHGTCCAGIASATTNSLFPTGVAGVGWHCRLMPIRIIFTEATLLNALNWALNNHANIISMSWYWDGAQSNIDASLQACFNAGIVLVAASGNDAPQNPDIIYYPARNANVIAVGATNENDRRCRGGYGEDWSSSLQGSQYGPELSVVAPGVHTWSTDRRGLTQGYNTGGQGDAAGDYYQDFGGTSGATPHVAGLAGLLLAFNPTLTPMQIRTIIENTADDMVGDPTEDTAGWDKYMGHGRINAYAALINAQTNHPFTPADVYIRDSLSDTGIEPHIGYPLCYSPDIIVRKTAVVNPQIAFANMAVDPGSDKVEIGSDNYIYVRVHNKGNIVSDIHVQVYFAPLSTNCSPDQWNPIGQIDFFDVPAGADAVSEKLIWASVPDPGIVDHFCLIASIEGFRDPHPDPAGIISPSQYMDFIRNHNNICYRNVEFENVFANTLLPVNFVMAGLAGTRDRFDLRIEKQELAIRARADLKLPHHMFIDTRVRLDNMIEKSRPLQKRFRTFQLADEKRSTIKGLIMPPIIRDVAQLEVKIPDDARPGEVYQIAVQQLFDDEVIGDFQIIAKVIDLNKTKFIAVRGSPFVHKANCKGLEKTYKQLWIPFESLEDARGAGYDMSLDCLNQPFTAKDVSHRLARRILHFVNNVELAEDLHLGIKDTLGIGYFEDRYGKQEANKVGYGIGIDVARMIIEERDKVGRFTKLSQIEAVKGVGVDKFIDLVNTFKR